MSEALQQKQNQAPVADVVLKDRSTDSCGKAGNGTDSHVLASQDPWGILCRTGAKGQWREMDSLIWPLTLMSQGCGGAGAQCPSAATPTAQIKLDRGGHGQKGC